MAHQKKYGFFAKTRDRIASFFRKQIKQQATPLSREPAPSRNVFPVISEKKAQKIKSLCSQLISDKEILNSGKVQFLNFSQVKRHMGAKWDRLEPIVLNITQDVLSKYTDLEDIFFRYNQEDFLILFAKASPEESELKCSLMAAEIKRLLFDIKQDNEDMKELELEHVTVSSKVSSLMRSDNILETLNNDMDDKMQKQRRQKETSETAQKRRTFFITTPEEAHGQHSDPEYSIRYLPLQKQGKQSRPFYLLALNQKEEHPLAHSLLESICLYMGANKKDRAEYDLTILKDAEKTLSERPSWKVICIVDYETLASDTYAAAYKKELRKLPESSRNRLVMGVINIPSDAPLPTLYRVAEKVKRDCHYVLAYVPLNLKIGFSDLINAGFRGIGILILEPSELVQKRLKHEVETFAEKAKRLNMTSMLVLDADDPEFFNEHTKGLFDLYSSPELEKEGFKKTTPKKRFKY